MRLGHGEAVDEGEEAGGDQDRAGDVELGTGLTAGAPEQQPAADERDGRQGDVDVEGPAPVGVLGEDTAQQQADGRAGTGDRAEDAERLGALLGVGERGGQQGERGGREQRAEDALEGAARDQDLEVGGRAGHGRGGRESPHARQEGELAAEEVGDPAAEQQQAAEGQ